MPSTSSAPAGPVVLASRVTEVQVHRRGAVVTREAPLEGAWPDELALDGLPLTVDDDSVRAWLVAPGDAAGLPVPADVRAEVFVPPAGADVAPPAPRDLAACELRIAEARERLERVDAELRLLERFKLELPPLVKTGAPPAAPRSAWAGLIAWLGEARARRLRERLELSRGLAAAEEERGRLARRDAEVRALRDAVPDVVYKRVRVRLRGGDPARWRGPATLRVEYRVAGARWAPTYVLRVARDGRSARLGLRAHVAQATGEAWERVRLSLSTADLAREARLPELPSLRIGRRQADPPRRGWRSAPAGADALFADVERALRTAPPPPRPTISYPPGGPPRPPLPGGPLEPHPAPELDPFYEDGDGDARQENPFAAPYGPDPFAGTSGSDPFARPAGGDPFGGDPFGAPAGAAMFGGDPFGADSSAELAVPDDFNLGAAAPPPEADRSPPRPSMAPSMSAMPMAPPGAAPPSPKAGAPRGAPSARRASAPEPAKKRAAPARGPSREGAMLGGGGGGSFDDDDAALLDLGPGELAPADWQLRYGSLRMGAWDDRAARGRLRRTSALAGLGGALKAWVKAQLREAAEAARRVDHCALPPGAVAVEASSGAFDHRYEAAAVVDVPCDGELHNVPLREDEAPVQTLLVVAPRVDATPVRTATLTNPLEAPLLAGQADVYLDDELLVQAPVRTVPAGGSLTVGLGVEQALKVARNVRYEEESTGLLGGGLLLRHTVTIELASRLPAPATVEVREVVPQPAEGVDDVAVTDEQATPAWERWEQDPQRPLAGGRRWRVTLDPGAKAELVARWAVKLDAKNELEGGNRRA